MNPYEPPSSQANAKPNMRNIARLIIEYDVKPFNAMPPLYRLFWKLGIEVKPPLYASFNEILASGIVGATMWTMVMRLFVWQSFHWFAVVAGGFMFACV